MLKKKIIVVFCVVTAMVALTGCSVIRSIFFRGEAPIVDYNVIVAESIDDMEEWTFYIDKGDGTYHRVYIGDTSFDWNYLGDKSERVAWFGKDYDKIPTMHRGEKLVFRATSEFNNNFVIERYEDLGFTVGINGLRETQTGRFSVNVGGNDGWKTIDLNSSAGVLNNLGEHELTIEKIGGVELRGGNISRAGTIMGLEGGRSYETDAYIGTDVMKYSLVADVRALVSMEEFYLHNFEYDGSRLVSIELPRQLESGYYLINGYGFVRYIDSDREFTEAIDMNIPNSIIDDSGEIIASDDEEEEDDGFADFKDDVKKTAYFRMDSDAHVKIVLTYSEAKADVAIAPPIARIYSEYGVYTLNPATDTTLEGEFTLRGGDYRIEIDGLYGRTYKYKVIREEDFPTGGPLEKEPIRSGSTAGDTAEPAAEEENIDEEGGTAGETPSNE